MIEGFGATLKKTFQNLSKGSDSRRRRDGLPPSAMSTSKLVTNVPRAESSNQVNKEFTTPKQSDTESLESAESSDRRSSGESNIIGLFESKLASDWSQFSCMTF